MSSQARLSTKVRNNQAQEKGESWKVGEREG